MCRVYAAAGETLCQQMFRQLLYDAIPKRVLSAMIAKKRPLSEALGSSFICSRSVVRITEGDICLGVRVLWRSAISVSPLELNNSPEEAKEKKPAFLIHMGKVFDVQIFFLIIVRPCSHTGTVSGASEPCVSKMGFRVRISWNTTFIFLRGQPKYTFFFKRRCHRPTCNLTYDPNMNNIIDRGRACVCATDTRFSTTEKNFQTGLISTKNDEEHPPTPTLFLNIRLTLLCFVICNTLNIVRKTLSFRYSS